MRRRPLLRAAAIGGGAYRSAGRRRMAESGRGMSGLSPAGMAKLGQLGRLYERGLLTEAEFTAQKAKLLSG